MKILLFFIIIFLNSFISNVYCQNIIYVEYDVIRNGLESEAILYASKTESLFIEGKNSNEKVSEFETNSFTIGKFRHTQIHQDLNSPQILYIDQFKNENRFSTIHKDYFIKDTIPPLDWEIVNSPEKEVAGFKCKSAKVKFRGSTFLAYYTTEIPTSFGPWKFGNLSGLILKVSSMDNSAISWEAKKIVYPYHQEDENLFKMEADKYSVSMQSFVEEQDILLEDLSKNIAAKMGNPYTPISKRDRREKTLERKYEWETW